VSLLLLVVVVVVEVVVVVVKEACTVVTSEAPSLNQSINHSNTTSQGVAAAAALGSPLFAPTEMHCSLTEPFGWCDV